jgi:hypothetical protein
MRSEFGGYLLSEFFDAAGWTLADFERRHAQAFLVFPGGVRGLRVVTRPQRTGSDELTSVGPSPILLGALRPLRADSLAFPVCHSKRGLLASIIGVGRTENNDVVIRDSSLSKFHAFFQQGESGEWLLKDAGSRNGTFLNDAPLPPKEGPAVVVPFRSRIRLGFVELGFIGAAEVLENVRRLAARP